MCGGLGRGTPLEGNFVFGVVPRRGFCKNNATAEILGLLNVPFVVADRLVRRSILQMPGGIGLSGKYLTVVVAGPVS